MVIVLKMLFSAIVVNVVILALAILDRRASCVILPNGYCLGRLAMFELDDSIYTSIRLITPNGQLVLTGTPNIELYRHSTDPQQIVIRYPGGEMAMDGRQIMPIIAGNMFNEGWNSPNEPLGVHLFGTDFYSIYFRLQEAHWGKSRHCGTKLFAFHPPR
ncbi:hypothetical protein FJU08_06725 [Martelella alba]|uniref:Uncharacterized protein n=1 Tax=Martelella alba TaxID=2590451 RepID=A0A506UF60_9HYPH|nr:hypothetical protein [Martelella alba]TPW31449.1 hypothetical protein FJU08_06725 [Martelella alba]